MKILILGGTIFVGRHIVEAALKRGHEVTLFNRGKTESNLFPSVEKIVGDRFDSLDRLAGRHWDVVIDSSAYVPRAVKLSCESLKSSCDLYLLISTGSVYKDKSKTGISEVDEILTPQNPDSLEWSDETYGEMKAGCEVVTQNIMQEKALIVRPGVVVGPHDPTDRFTYWPLRVQRGGKTLAPGEPNRPMQFIDARDLAEWSVLLSESKATGIYNAIGPDYKLTMSNFLTECKSVTNSDAEFNWIPDQILLEQNVIPWSELPFWIPANSETSGMALRNNKKAIDSGLKFRPVRETIEDTLNWWQKKKSDCELKAGLSKEREEKILNLAPRAVT